MRGCGFDMLLVIPLKISTHTLHTAARRTTLVISLDILNTNSDNNMLTYKLFMCNTQQQKEATYTTDESQ